MERPARLAWCVYTLIFIEGCLFTLLGPLLPTLKAELGLSTSQAGVLAAGYMSGAVVGAPPAALVSARLGMKTCAVTGVALMAVGSLAFGLCGTFVALLVAQLVAGVGATALWIGAGSWLLSLNPPSRRGAVVGAMFGVAALGEIVGPVVGAVAASVGRTATFTCVAVFALVGCSGLIVVARPPSSSRSLGFRASAASRPVRIAAALCFLPTIVWGALVVVATLELDRLGASPAAIGATYVIAAVIGAVQAPLVGTWSDRCGRLLPIRLGLFICIPALIGLAWAESSVVVALLMILAFIAIRFVLGPAVASLSDACEETGGGNILALAVSLPATAAGLAVGSVVSGALAQAVGSSWTYILFAAGLGAVLVALRAQTDIVATGDEPTSPLAARVRAAAE